MKKSIIIASILVLAGILVACAARQQFPSGGPGGGPQSGSAGRQTGGGASTQTAELPLESKVGIGILKLEGTEQAVDAEEAKDLLVLFKALKTLSTESNTAVDEISALNIQIKNTLKADQLAAIEKMSITMQDLRTLTQSYGVETTGYSSGTSSSSSRSNFNGGPGGMGGMIGGMMGGGPESSSSTKATPNAAAALTISRKAAGGYNLTFADAIIKLLESKISQ
ncbi:MAG: hypothetical protein GYA15_06170 [Leptolinea sp.]|nr:hypothetical protein [Leptolinea sp.]